MGIRYSMESISVVIISGEISNNEADKLKNALEDLPEVFSGVKKFRIHAGEKLCNILVHGILP